MSSQSVHGTGYTPSAITHYSRREPLASKMVADKHIELSKKA